MAIKVKELTVDELQDLISNTVRESMEDLIEEIRALSSKRYLNSIKEARADYKAGRVKKIEDYLNV